MRERSGFGVLLARSLAGAGLFYAAVVAYAVPTVLMGQEPARPPSVERQTVAPDQDALTWRPAYAERFPGCKDMARWKAEDVPSTVVVVRRDGVPFRMDFDAAYRRLTGNGGADGLRAVGACH